MIRDIENYSVHASFAVIGRRGDGLIKRNFKC